MADLTSQQLSDIRSDLGSIESAFEDAEFQRYYDRMANASDENMRYQATLGMAVRAFVHDAAKFHEYTAGETSHKKDQVYKQYIDLYVRFYGQIVEPLLSSGGSQVVWAALRSHPHQTRTEPQS